jgi:hypothetical protein
MKRGEEEATVGSSRDGAIVKMQKLYRVRLLKTRAWIDRERTYKADTVYIEPSGGRELRWSKGLFQLMTDVAAT